MTAIDKLDGFYQQTLDGKLSQDNIRELTKILESIVTMSNEFLTSQSANLCNERKNKFRKLRDLSCAETTEIERGHDPLCHYALIREYLNDAIEFVKRGCEEIFV